MNWIIENAPEWNGLMAVLLYWLPAVICFYGYMDRAARNVQLDRRARESAERKEDSFYIPSVTVGTLIGYVALAICPAANLCAAMFDLAPKLLSGFLDWCSKVLDIPLVPRRRK